MVFGFIGNLGPTQLIVCLVVLFLLFGAKKIPDMARALGKAKGEFKKGLAEGEKAEKEAEALKDEKAEEPAKELA